MAGSFLLDWEEMSKTFSELKTELFKKEATTGTLEARPSPMEYVGWSPREKVGWASVHSQGGGRSYRNGVSIQSRKAIPWLCCSPAGQRHRR